MKVVGFYRCSEKLSVVKGTAVTNILYSVTSKRNRKGVVEN
jgi:hypothetical protein